MKNKIKKPDIYDYVEKEDLKDLKDLFLNSVVSNFKFLIYFPIKSVKFIYNYILFLIKLNKYNKSLAIKEGEILNKANDRKKKI